MEIEDIEKLINEIYKDVNPLQVSVCFRNKYNITDKSFVYGEIIPSTFCSLLNFVNLNNQDIFYDLGRSSGKQF